VNPARHASLKTGESRFGGMRGEGEWVQELSDR
jgi:hypothetical protein